MAVRICLQKSYSQQPRIDNCNNYNQEAVFVTLSFETGANKTIGRIRRTMLYFKYYIVNLPSLHYLI